MEGELTSKLHRKRNEIMEKKFGYKEFEPMKRKFKWGACLDKPIDLSGKFMLETSPLPESCTNSELPGSEIQEFFRDANVFITGGTGFMGKTLVEKLLTSCPNIKNIYLLIRQKKGKTFQERFNELFSDSVFSRLHKLVPSFRERVVAVDGDCSKARLGLSDKDYQFLAENVDVVFHGAATVRFDEKLKIAVNINVRSVKEMIEFGHQCKKLKSMIHTSTAYANCHILNQPIQEEFYPASINYRKLLELAETESEERLDEITPTVIHPWPNTYTFTKQVAESVVQKEGRGLPLSIYRPAIVIASYKEPVRGWTDNIYGPTGIIVGAGTGLLRVVQCDVNHVANLVPVDLATNGMIAASWKTAMDAKKNKKNDISIYNYVSSTRNPVRWGDFITWNEIYGHDWPTTRAIWYSCFNQCKSKLGYFIMAFLLHTLPAFLADTVLVAMRKKPMLSKIYKKIHRFNEIVSYFSQHTFDFVDNNIMDLWNQLTPRDKEIYPFDIEDADWDFYSRAHLLGLRIHLVKDPIDTLDEARMRWKRLHVIHRSVQVSLVLLLIWIFFEMYYTFFTDNQF